MKAVDQKIKERKELSGEQLSPLAACKLIKGQGRCRGCPSDYCAKKAAGTMANHYRLAKKVIRGGQTP